ncbi:MAG: STN domain-containing protein [Opitutaceae bacterium]|nr:STN domain-containing protein [Opitutaceae bacterium]
MAAERRAASPDDSPVQQFEVPAGKAERTLGVFVRQSSTPAVFPADIVEGVLTNAVRGNYTAEEALGLMLAGTALQPHRDAGSNALVIKRTGGELPPIIELPPYVVETMAAPVNWSYAEVPGVEVISRCTDAATQMLLDHHFILLNKLGALLPEEFRAKLDVPTTYVLYDDANQPGIAREILDAVSNRPDGTGNPNIRGLSNYRFWDRDVVALFFVIDEQQLSRGRLSLTPDSIRFMLENRTPSLPAWFVEGMVELYGTAVMETMSATQAASSAAQFDGHYSESLIVIRRATWISEAETQLVRKQPRQPRDFLPLAAMFGARPEEEQRALWRSQTALFIRWALDGGRQHSRREALWQFVRRACLEPVTEPVFQECFGLDYAAAGEQLRKYLPAAVKDTIYLQTNDIPIPPKANLRDATAGEVSRLKGRLDRLEIAYVKRAYPELAAQYVGQARRTLRKSYDNGDRDPRLLAELGLCECEAGDDAAARPFLEAAVHGRVVHPRVYYELARINYHELCARIGEGKLSATEAGDILKPLSSALRQSPPLPEVYELIAEVWLRSNGKLTPAQLAVLDEGVRNFAWRPRLIYSAALLNSLQGRVPEARRLIAKGLLAVATMEEKAVFLKLRDALDHDMGAPAN